MQVYRFGKVRVAADAVDLQDYLKQAHGKKDRPLCDCTPAGVPMYVAHVGDRYLIKRWPDSGAKHAADGPDGACPSYEPPPELSGRGAVLGHAVQDAGEETALRLDFSLSKTAGKSAPQASGKESDTVRTDGAKLTLRGLLHYLWDEAALNRWSPAMEGKRDWYVVRRELLGAMQGKTAKKAPLDGRVFIPEKWAQERDDEITARRIAMMADMGKPGKTQPLMIAIGEVKAIAPARYGMKLIVRHLPSFHFMMEADLHRRFEKRFANALALWNGVEGAHLIFIGTFSLGPTGIASLATLSVMVVSDRWIPFEDMYDQLLLERLLRDRRRFVKGLRYNLAEDQPLANAVLTDTAGPTALYVLTPGAGPESRATLDALISQSEVTAWVWDADEPMAPLPESKWATNHRPAALPAPDQADHEASAQ